jgi:signal peptidase I
MTEESAEKVSGGFAETVRTIVYAVVIAVGIRTAAFEPFNIPSESMLPTLLVGDYLFVSKYSYGYSRHSLPFSPPLFSGRIFGADPERGDVAVFKFPRDNKTDYIKRIVGLPGDRIQVIGGRLHINGEAVARERISDYPYRDAFGNLYRVPQYRETLPGGRSYRTLDLLPAGDLDNTVEYVVPAGHFFAMGDNRDNSIDSRVESAVGMVPAENLVGRAEFLFFSTDGTARLWEFWKWPFAVRYGRLFTAVGS